MLSSLTLPAAAPAVHLPVHTHISWSAPPDARAAPFWPPSPFYPLPFVLPACPAPPPCTAATLADGEGALFSASLPLSSSALTLPSIPPSFYSSTRISCPQPTTCQPITSLAGRARQGECQAAVGAAAGAARSMPRRAVSPLAKACLQRPRWDIRTRSTRPSALLLERAGVCLAGLGSWRSLGPAGATGRRLQRLL